MNATCSKLPTPRARLRGAERARRKNAAVLRSNDRETAILSGRLIAAQESERQRIARELHDNLCQKLSLLITKNGPPPPRVTWAGRNAWPRTRRRATDIKN